MFSDTTTAVLDTYTSKGGVLSIDKRKRISPEAQAIGTMRAAEVRLAKARAAYAPIVPLIRELRSAGLSLGGIADILNGTGHNTRRGSNWSAMQVSRVLSKFSTELSAQAA
jgi:hypothetical protein